MQLVLSLNAANKRLSVCDARRLMWFNLVEVCINLYESNCYTVYSTKNALQVNPLLS